ncbi:MAG TPA: hypothetical protein DCQ37_09845 [Desulfobacteraceae bacterium]|nr:hypothetical protein [Desulfobacteraceae bacterium]
MMKNINIQISYKEITEIIQAYNALKTFLEKVVVPKEVIFQANLPERKERLVNIKKYRGIARNIWQDADAYIDELRNADRI